MAVFVEAPMREDLGGGKQSASMGNTLDNIPKDWSDKRSTFSRFHLGLQLRYLLKFRRFNYI